MYRGIVPHIFNTGIGGGKWGTSKCFGEEKHFLPLAGIEPQTVQLHSLITILNTQSWFLLICGKDIKSKC